MCGRFTLSSPAELVADLVELSEPPSLTPRYNIAPTQPVATVMAEGESAGRNLRMMRWGLIPSWADDPSIGSRMINARAETVAGKPAFRAAFRRRRCLIPADGFYEWKKVNGAKQPYYVRQRGGGPFAFAGLWEGWTSPEDEHIESCTLITTEPNATVADLHNRMPVILGPETFGAWLDPEGAPEGLQGLLRPCPDDWLEIYPVSRMVNNPSNDRPECVEPIPG